MKRLTLLRHAHADWPVGSSRDFDRPLDALGHKGAHIMASKLAYVLADADHILVSPAVRAVQTHALLARAIGLAKAHSEARLYMASSDMLLEVLHEQPDQYQHILIIGHNPGLQYLAAHLLPAREGARIAQHFPTSAFATLECALPWSLWEASSARLVHHSWPQQIDPSIENDE